MSDKIVQEKIHSIMHDIFSKASMHIRTIAFPDTQDIRILQACRNLADNNIAKPVLVGNRKSIESLAKEHSIHIHDIQIIEPDLAINPNHVSQLMENRKHKAITEQEAYQILLDPLFFAGILLSEGNVDGCVAGNTSTTGKVIQAGLWTVGKEIGINTISSYFLMLFPDKVLVYADAGVVPSPNPEELCDIAFTTAHSVKKVLGLNPKLAFLSFSTKNSAEHADVNKVRAAYSLFSNMHPEIEADGELQADAALVPEITQRKAPGSRIQGNANILIFPDLDAGNIAYKLTERLAGAKAIGPIIQGLKKPYCDLSRGCSVDDIVAVTAICSLMAAKEG